jgi:putative acetyltransferase
MPPPVTIRAERRTDVAAITEVTRAAFRRHPHSGHTEHHIVAALRLGDALAVSLVAEVDGRVIGHIAFSPVGIGDRSPAWYGLGPMAVLPERQGQGIGRALIERGLAALRALGAQGCVVLGEPEFYGRFGFRSDRALVLERVPPEHFLSLPFGERRARGPVPYHEAFSARG